MPNRFYTAADEASLNACHLTIKEVRCHADGNPEIPCSDCGGRVLMLVETAEGFKAIREEYGGPITITSGYRCRKKQDRLFREAVAQYGSPERAKRKVAKPGSSPHEYAVALDMKTPSGMSSADFKRVIEGVLGQECRLGKYDTFVHFDRGYLLAPNPHPLAFKRGVRW